MGILITRRGAFAAAAALLGPLWFARSTRAGRHVGAIDDLEVTAHAERSAADVASYRFDEQGRLLSVTTAADRQGNRRSVFPGDAAP